MTPQQLQDVLRMRRLRESHAETGLERARRLERQARHGLEQAHGALATFDRDLERRLAAFRERARAGIGVGSIEAMRTFHAERLVVRESFTNAVVSAEGLVKAAASAVEDARRKWIAASNAAGNVSDIADRETVKRNKLRGRLEENESDDVSASRFIRGTESL